LPHQEISSFDALKILPSFLFFLQHPRPPTHLIVSTTLSSYVRARLYFNSHLVNWTEWSIRPMPSALAIKVWTPAEIGPVFYMMRTISKTFSVIS
jgi:hypothetical protein